MNDLYDVHNGEIKINTLIQINAFQPKNKLLNA